MGTKVSSVCDTDKRYGRPCVADALLFGGDERSGEAFTTHTCYAEEAVVLIGSSKNRWNRATPGTCVSHTADQPRTLKFEGGGRCEG